MEGLEHERAFFERFVVAPRRARALVLLDLGARGDAERRRELVDRLNHGFEHELIAAYVVVVPPKQF